MDIDKKISVKSKNCSVTSLQYEEKGVFMLKINKTSKKNVEESNESLSIKNLKEDFAFEYKLENENK